MQAASKTVVGGRKLLCFGMCSQVDGLLQASECPTAEPAMTNRHVHDALQESISGQSASQARTRNGVIFADSPSVYS